VANAVGLKETFVVENHHNFAWQEKLPDGKSVIVHRKGATPAGAGVLGVIPGSMGDAGYVVRGRGVSDSLESASHGAGRLMSRKAALNAISKSTRDEYLQERGVTLLGGGMDESPQAYKPIDTIIAAQSDLVEVIGKFMPRIVRMADESGEY
jgi:tRNA-splicing ligase RtcB